MSVAPQRKKNPLLSQFYFAEGAKSAPVLPTTQAAPANPLDINSDAFLPDAYFQTLLKERSLVELVTIDNNLRQSASFFLFFFFFSLTHVSSICIAAVRTLDNNLKTLVYENYNKFISATETIKSMKSNVEKMESDMAKLSANMRSIDTICTGGGCKDGSAP